MTTDPMNTDPNAPLPLPPGLTPEMLAQLPTPDEVSKEAEKMLVDAERQKAIDAHNLGVSMAREQQLEARRVRRAKAGKPNRGDINAAKRKPGLNKAKRRRTSSVDSSSR